MAGFCRSLLLVAALLPAAGIAATAPAQLVLPTPDTALPVELTADFSEFDRKNNRLVFKRLHIVQGPLAITADEATADPADFIRSTWIFTGNVVLQNTEAQVTCDRAEVTFRENRLRSAVLRGNPATFTQPRVGQQPPAVGRAGMLEYDVDASTIRMSGDAWLSDGTSEISGALIAYDLRREVVTAGADKSGQVRMKITPPKKPAQ